MKVPAEAELELELNFGNMYRDLAGGDIDNYVGGEPIIQEIPYHHPENQPQGRAVGQGDFSEFLWMEHEDEYDREVIRELEEEEMINYYFDLYQDTLDPSANNHEPSDTQLLEDLLRLCNAATNQQPCVPAPTPTIDTTSNHLNQDNVNGSNYRNHSNGEDLSCALGRILTFRSTLNPNAPEFVPRNVRNGESN